MKYSLKSTRKVFLNPSLQSHDGNIAFSGFRRTFVA